MNAARHGELLLFGNNKIANDLHNHCIGLENFIAQLTTDKPNPPYPPYNIERINNDTYRIVIALAGFTADRLSVELNNDELIVKDIENKPTIKENVEYIHKGIANRSFILKFNLSPEIVVDDAKFIDGLLIINMHREIPENKKTKRIQIQ